MSGKVWVVDAAFTPPPSQPSLQGKQMEVDEHRITDLAFCTESCCLAIACWSGSIYLAHASEK
jgi:hypothetical protein